MALTPRQQRFVDEYLIDLNATQAAIRAGYEWPDGCSGFYVYFLIDPRDNVIFYVGKGKGRRMAFHKMEAVSSRPRNGVKAARILSILRSGLTPVERVFAHGLPEPAAYAIERDMISQLRGGLTNMAGGVVSRDESDLAVMDDVLLRVKPFDQWFMDARDAQLVSARSLCGTAAAFYSRIVGELLWHRDALAERVAINVERGAA